MARIYTGGIPFEFPLAESADGEGLVLIGGEPTPSQILEGYRKGIFPWYEDDSLPLWWSPDPRFVLFPDELHVSRSMHKELRKGHLRFTVNAAFEKVIAKCAAAEREGQQGTWITPGMQQAYTVLHRSGWAHSAEVWRGEELVGGLYGVRIGAIFFAESMFHTAANASKVALIRYVKQLATEGVQLIDCQVHTAHLQSLGAGFVSRSGYLRLLSKWCGAALGGER